MAARRKLSRPPHDTGVGKDVAAASRLLAATKDIPQTIVVAIDFTTEDGYWQDLPTIDKGGRWEIDEKRGAANLLRTPLENIKPSIDRSYRTNPADAGMAGHSLAAALRCMPCSMRRTCSSMCGRPARR